MNKVSIYAIVIAFLLMGVVWFIFIKGNSKDKVTPNGEVIIENQINKKDDEPSVNNQEKIIKAEQVLTEAIQLSPTNQQGYWNLAEVELAQGKMSEAISFLKKAVDLEPQFGYSHWYLAMAYKIVGQNQLAEEEVLKAETVNSPIDLNTDLNNLKKAIEIGLAAGDDKNLVRFYSKAVILEPKDTQLWAGLAAREAAQKVIEIDPQQASKVQGFLKNLPQQ